MLRHDASAIIEALAMAAGAHPAPQPGPRHPYHNDPGRNGDSEGAHDPNLVPPRIILRAQADRHSARVPVHDGGARPQLWPGFALGLALSGAAGGVLYGLLTAL